MKKSAPSEFLPDYPSQVRFAELLTLRTLAASTQAEYRRYLRKLAARVRGDPADLDEAQVRAHLLHLTEAQHYSPSSMRTAVAALQLFYGGLLRREWRLFDLVRSPSAQTLPAVLTRAQVARLFAVVRETRFRAVLRLIYACGLRVGEAVRLEVRDIEAGQRVRFRQATGAKDRLVPLPAWALAELRAWWKTHRHPRLLFPGIGRGWREHRADLAARATAADAPMSVSSVQHCVRLAVAAAGLPTGTCVHTLRHSYATHLLEAEVSIRLISAYLGHSSLETTLVYTHLTAANAASARAALATLRPDAAA